MRLRTVFLGNMLLLLPSTVTADVMSVTGADDPRLASLDQLMTGFLTRHQLPGASLAVTYQGRLVYARGFGAADSLVDDPVKPTACFGLPVSRNP